MSEPGPDYQRALAATQKHHREHKTFSGRFLFRYLDDVKMLVEKYGCKTMLDYGCGKGVQYTQPLDNGKLLAEFLGVEVTKYDPGWPEFAAEPEGKFDLVICTQALGAIPIDSLPWAIGRLYGFASKAVYVAERIRPVKKNLHKHMAEKMPYLKPHEWWAGVLRRSGDPVACWLRTKNYLAEGMPKQIESLNDIPPGNAATDVNNPLSPMWMAGYCS